VPAEEKDHPRIAFGKILKMSATESLKKRAIMMMMVPGMTRAHPFARRIARGPPFPGSVAHGDTSPERCDQVHDSLGEGDFPFGYRPVGKQFVVFGGDCNDRVAECEGIWGMVKSSVPIRMSFQVIRLSSKAGNLKAEVNSGQLREEVRFMMTAGYDPDNQEKEHGRYFWIAQEKIGGNEGDTSQHRCRPHPVDSFDDEERPRPSMIRGQRVWCELWRSTRSRR